MAAHKELRKKLILAKKQKQNRPVPNWIRYRTGNTIKEWFYTEGSKAKVFKAKFHGKGVAMKYIPLDKVKDYYQYRASSYGCDEFYWQEKFSEPLELR